jgi:hypothetical protein
MLSFSEMKGTNSYSKVANERHAIMPKGAAHNRLQGIRTFFRAKYAARSSGLTAVPVIHGSAAVVTMATRLPGSLKLLEFFSRRCRFRFKAWRCKHAQRQAAVGKQRSQHLEKRKRTGVLQPKTNG